MFGTEGLFLLTLLARAVVGQDGNIQLFRGVDHSLILYSNLRGRDKLHFGRRWHVIPLPCRA